MLALQVYQPPLAHDRKAYNIEDHQALCLQLQFDGYMRDQRDTKASDHTLFDGAVITHLHADLEGHACLLESPFQGSAGSRTDLTQQEMLARQFLEGDLLAPGQAMGGRGNQHQFVGREWLDNHGDFGRDSAHNRHIDAVLDERIDQRGTVQHVQGYLNFGKELAKLAQQAGDDIGANSGVGPNAQSARFWAAKRFHRLHGFVDDRENL